MKSMRKFMFFVFYSLWKGRDNALLPDLLGVGVRRQKHANFRRRKKNGVQSNYNLLRNRREKSVFKRILCAKIIKEPEKNIIVELNALKETFSSGKSMYMDIQLKCAIKKISTPHKGCSASNRPFTKCLQICTRLLIQASYNIHMLYVISSHYQERQYKLGCC